MDANEENMIDEEKKKGELQENEDKPNNNEEFDGNPQKIEEDESRKGKSCFNKWRNKEKIRYLMFLNMYKNDLENKDVEKMKMYERLSDFVEITSPNMCCIYHLNYLKKYQNIEGIIQYLKMTIIYNEEELKVERQKAKLKVMKYKIRDMLVKRKELREVTKSEHQGNKISMRKKESFDKKIECWADLNLNPQNHTLEETKTQPQKTNNHPLYEISEKTEILETISQIKVPILILLVIKRKITHENKHFVDQQQRVSIAIEKFERNHLNKLIRSRKLKKLDKGKSKGEFTSNKVSFEEVLNHKISPTINEDINHENDIIRPSPCLGIRMNRWTRVETMKLIILMNIYKENIEYYFHNKKYAFSIKCCEYVNTNKTPRNCHHRMTILLRKHKLPITKIVEIETERLQIPQSLIEKEKLAYFDKENKPSICQISFETKPIEKYIDSDTLAQIIKDTLDYKVQLETQVFLRLKVINQNELRRGKTEAEKEPKKKENENAKVEIPKVQIRNAKEVVEVEVENSLFETIKKTYKSKSLLNETDFVLLRKRTVQIINLKKNP